jgi:hypothetical protein
MSASPLVCYHAATRQLLHALLYPDASDRRTAGPTERRPRHPCSRAAADIPAVTWRTPDGRLNVVSTRLSRFLPRCACGTSGCAPRYNEYFGVLAMEGGAKSGADRDQGRFIVA